MIYLFLFIISYSISKKLISDYANKIGDEKIETNKKTCCFEYFIIITYCLIHFFIFNDFKHYYFTSVIEGIFFANTFLLIEMDIKYKQVYDLYHFINLASMVIYIGYIGFPSNYISFLIFAGSQLLVFQFLYGQADAFLYCECAAFMFIHNAVLIDYFLFMAISILFLGIIQCFRKNINKFGNLKEAVAFTPYIYCGFIVYSFVNRFVNG